ncbi:MAG: response regulator transcription factor [Clostridiales bacterium]|nr:response regulator transcription factor [Clostridiales bacterium]
MTKILLVDDEPLLLESLEIILSYAGDYEVTGKAGNGVEALTLLSKDVPDVMLVDLNMPGMGGIELIPKVHEEYPNVKIIVLTTFYDEKNIAHAIAGGACGYLLKDSGKDAILNAISQALQGRSVLDLKVMQKLNTMLASGAIDDSSSETAGSSKPFGNTDAGTDTTGNSTFAKGKGLLDLDDFGMTDREKEICRLISEGCTNSQIASILFISEGTVKNYVSTIYDKLGEHDRTKVVLMLTRCRF